MKNLFLVIALIFTTTIFAQERPKIKSTEPQVKATEKTSDEDQDLRKAIEASGGDRMQVIENLDAFLKKYPNSSRREEIERESYKIAKDLRDKNRQITFAERLVANDEQDLEMLTVLVTELRERKAEGDLAKALGYANKLVKAMDDIFATRTKPMKVSPGQWDQQKRRGFASVYLLRGQVQNDLGNLDLAEADLQKSHKNAPLAATLALLGNIAEKRKSTEQAIDYYTQAFVRAIENNEGVDRNEIRQKLGLLYAGKHGNENGLGDKILKTYDTLTKEDAAREAKLEPPNPNEKLSDPLLFKLTKLDGGDVRLADFKGKVVIANFWATWCGPCRIEMPELEKAMVKYKDDKDVVFLAINTDDDRNYVEPYVKGQKVKLPVVYANYLDNFYAISSIPTTMIFDRNGQISFRQAGFNPREDFVTMISEKIEAAKKKTVNAQN